VLTTVTVEENTNGLISLYPNPAHGYFTLDMGALQAEKVSITDVTGRTVAEYHQVTGSLRIDLSNAEAGLYYGKVATSSKEYMFKLLNVK